MESYYFHKIEVARHALLEMIKACERIIDWNSGITCVQDYLSSPGGVKTMAATGMMLEAIGESVKKIDKEIPGFLTENAPRVPWREIKGLRDHIAHGYFDIDADIILDVAKNEIAPLRDSLLSLVDRVNDYSE